MGAHIRLGGSQDEFVRLFAKRNGMSISDAANQLIAAAMEQIESGNMLNILGNSMKKMFQEAIAEFSKETGDRITKRLAGLMALNTNYTLRGFWLTKDILNKLMLLEHSNWENLANEGLSKEVKKLVDELEKSSEGQMRQIYQTNRKKAEDFKAGEP